MKLLILLLLPMPCLAQEWQFNDTYPLGVTKQEIDETRVTGWKLSERWYFGHVKDNDESGVAFVWKQDENEIKIYKEGIKFTKYLR